MNFTLFLNFVCGSHNTPIKQCCPRRVQGPAHPCWMRSCPVPGPRVPRGSPAGRVPALREASYQSLHRGRAYGSAWKPFSLRVFPRLCELLGMSPITAASGQRRMTGGLGPVNASPVQSGTGHLGGRQGSQGDPGSGRSPVQIPPRPQDSPWTSGQPWVSLGHLWVVLPSGLCTSRYPPTPPSPLRLCPHHSRPARYPSLSPHTRRS